ncbi:alpha carbonic anhydrase [Xylariaceae sp. FL1272]|nr:alpha carbonic anhydrase [Xylariaceae sp. FL1272]
MIFSSKTILIRHPILLSRGIYRFWHQPLSNLWRASSTRARATLDHHDFSYQDKSPRKPFRSPPSAMKSSLSICTLFLLANSVILAFGFCGARTYLDHDDATISNNAHSVPLAKFGYLGVKGPLMWHRLDAANAQCAHGRRQSPINLVPSTYKLLPATSLTVLLPDDVPEGAAFENLGSTIMVVMEGLGGSLVVDDLELELRQFHFHTPSEHLVNGMNLPMEMHMVFENSEMRKLAVVGIFVDVIEPTLLLAKDTQRHHRVSDILETIFRSVDDIAIPGSMTTSQPFCMTELNCMMNTTDFRQYSGSLTTPPCAEGLLWVVAVEKLFLTRSTFENVRRVIGFNSRVTQNTPGMPNLLEMAGVMPNFPAWYGAQTPI